MIINRWKLRPQFRLRTLLFGVTAVCIVLTALPFEARRYQQRKARTRNLITSLGGSVETIAFENEPSPGTNWLSEMLGYIEDRESLWQVDLNGKSLTSGDIETLSRCEWIVVLDLRDTNVDDDSLDHIARLTRLQELRLRNTLLTDVGVMKLKSLGQLSVLDVAGTAATYECLAKLEQEIPGANLQEQLAISRAQAAGVEVALGVPMLLPMALPKELQSNEAVIRWQVDGITSIANPEGADSVQVSLPTRLTPTLIEDLRRLASARSFDAKGIAFPEDGVRFLSDLTNLESVSIDDAGTGNLTDDDLQRLAKLPSLTTLELYSENLTDRGIAHLADAPRLASLSLSGNSFTVAGIKHLAAAPRLESLKLRGDRLTPEMLGHLRGIRWLRVLDLDLSHRNNNGKGLAPPPADTIAAARNAMHQLAGIPNLKQLSVKGNLMSAEVIEPVTELPRLEWLKVDGRIVSHEAARHLQEEMPHCHVQRMYAP